MRAMEKKAGLIFGGIFLFSLVIIVGLVMAATTQATTATVTVNTFLSVTLSAPIAFINMNPDQTLNATVGTGFPLTATIGVESNVDANVGTSADAADFSEIGGGSFAISNMEWSTTSTFPGTEYTDGDVQVCASVAPNSACNIYHQLTIPANQVPGIYSVGITISATQA